MSDVPIGRVQISVMSPSNYNIGHKTVNLEPGDLMELNFGDEGGYIITGTIRAGDDALERADVTLHSSQRGSKDSYFNNRLTDAEGRFKFTCVPDGQCMIYVNWKPSNVRKATKWPEDTNFVVRRPLKIERNMELEIVIENDIVIDTQTSKAIQDE